MKNHSIVTRIAAVIGITLGAFAISALADWTPAPAGGPPGCASGYAGCDAPIHVGAADQMKKGGLGLGDFTATTFPSSWLLYVNGSGTVNDLWTTKLHVIPANGSGSTLGAGKVLTDVNGDGIASWQDAPTGSTSGGPTGGVTKIIAGTNITINPITGVGNVTVNAIVPTTGTVAGGCSANSSPGKSGGPVWTGSAWGSGNFDGSTNTCSCPSAYTSEPILVGLSLATPSQEAFLCVKN